jgi:hypothetical protein
VIGDGLEAELSLDVEHVADVVEDASEGAVGQPAVVAILVDVLLVVEGRGVEGLLRRFGGDQLFSSWHDADGSRLRPVRP